MPNEAGSVPDGLGAFDGQSEPTEAAVAAVKSVAFQAGLRTQERVLL